MTISTADELDTFDLDSFIEGITPPTITKTVHTRGDLLGTYGELAEKRDKLAQAMTALAESLPDHGQDSDGSHRVEFEALRSQVEDVDQRLEQIKATYSQYRAKFSFTTISPSERARINTEHADHKGEGGIVQMTDQLLHLFLASVASITITHAGKDRSVNPRSWTTKQLLRFLNKIGDGQAALLWEAFLGLGKANEITPFDLAPETGTAH